MDQIFVFKKKISVTLKMYKNFLGAPPQGLIRSRKEAKHLLDFLSDLNWQNIRFQRKSATHWQCKRQKEEQSSGQIFPKRLSDTDLNKRENMAGLIL